LAVGSPVLIEGAKDIFLQHFREMKSGRGNPWAERCDTYMYLAQMRIAGWEVDYADLIVIAGYATSFAYAPRPQDRWMAHYFPIEGRDDRIAHATGYVNAWHQYRDVEEYWDALKREIDAGRAVHAPNEEDVLFIGYRDADEPEGRGVMPVAIVFVDEDEWSWERFVEWHSREMVSGWFGCMEGRCEPWPPRKSALEVLDVMAKVAKGNDPRRRPGDVVIWGIDGVEAYAADLSDLSKSGASEENTGYFQGGWRGCHNIMPQISGRPAAAEYLRRASGLFEGETRAQILESADHYEEATRAWMEFDRQLGRALDDMPHEEAWQDDGHRRAGADAVQGASVCEREALASLERALEIVGR
jgi:hypothetical protein